MTREERLQFLVGQIQITKENAEFCELLDKRGFLVKEKVPQLQHAMVQMMSKFLAEFDELEAEIKNEAKDKEEESVCNCCTEPCSGSNEKN